jgi:pimeloyl-ACP methyl ester carboxylesterase
MKIHLKQTCRWLVLVLALGLACSACRAAPAATEAAPQEAGIELTDCQLSAPGISFRLPARCGKLAVPENPQDPSGRQIELNLAVVPAISRSPAPDPLFFLTGGPGQAATESYLQLYFAFDRINQKRDIVLVDQRGTGASNPLDCPASEEMLFDSQADLAPFLEACLEQLDADPRFYTTPIAMQDLDRVREALGYQQINLYGLSYGTRAALTYIQMFPERVRAAILDGVIPQDEPLGPQVAPDAQHALDRILARCQAEPDCQAAFPDLSQTFQTLLDDLSDQAVMVELVDPVSGDWVQQEFDRQQFATAVRLLSYAQETVALLPLLFDTAHQRGDYGPLAAQYRIVAGQLNDSISNAMGYSVLCSEDFPSIDLQEAGALAQDTYYGDQEIQALEEICSIWPAGDLPPDYYAPVQADLPVLLLSGADDPVTPPENAEQAAQSLPNSLALVAPGQGHNVIYRGCLTELAFEFIEAGSLEGLDASCVQAIEPAPFFVNFNGPLP